MKTEKTIAENILSVLSLWERRDYLWRVFDKLGDTSLKEEGHDTNFDEDFSAFDESTESYELKQLNELHNSIGSWAADRELIKESYFVNYCEDYVHGATNIPDFLTAHVDWSGLADDFRQDYREVEFLGETYLVRN